MELTTISETNFPDFDNFTDDVLPKSYCPTQIPTFREYMTNLPKDYYIAFGVLGGLTFVMVLNYLEELYYLYRHTNQWQSRDKAKWLLAVYPLTAFTSCISLVAPRTAGINELIASMFVALCVHVFVIMLIDQYNGPKEMFRQLHGRRFRLNPPPICCCCCCCCCSKKVTKVHLQVIHAMVLQFVLIRPCLAYVTTLMWSDGTYGSTEDAEKSPQTYVMFVNTMSTLIAVYGFIVVKDQSVKVLSNIHVRQKFISLQAVLLIVGMQRSLIMSIFMTFNLQCEAPLHIESTVDRYHNMAVICEMAVLAIIARIYYRHTAQVYIGQIASKYRRRTQHFRDTLRSSLPHQSSRDDNKQSAHDVVIDVVTSQPSADATDGNRVATTAAAAITAEKTSSMDVVTVNIPLDEIRAMDADSGCSSYDEYEIVVQF